MTPSVRLSPIAFDSRIGDRDGWRRNENAAHDPIAEAKCALRRFFGR
jgi:hypothetical protein